MAYSHRIKRIDRSNRGAALLLMKMRMIAINEVCESSMFLSTEPEKAELAIATDPQPTNSSSFAPRCRSVSFSSQDDLTGTSSGGSSCESTPTSSPMGSPKASCSIPPTLMKLLASPGRTVKQTKMKKGLLAPKLPPKISQDQKEPHGTSTMTNTDPSSTQPMDQSFVGTSARRGKTVKAVLKKKFSWKSFPELEGYLIDNRAKYLEYSSQLNYTPEQKTFNNRLTQGLLNLAAESGYVFEGFTFPAVRDRIRCYYKSYVQAVKKKKRSRKRK